MAKHRLRSGGYSFVRNMRVVVLPGGIIDDSDPDFKVQAHKFEPVDETVAATLTENTQVTDLEKELRLIADMKRDDLLALYKKVTSKDAPEAATKGELRAALVALKDGDKHEQVAKDIWGV